MTKKLRQTHQNFKITSNPPKLQITSNPPTFLVFEFDVTVVDEQVKQNLSATVVHSNELRRKTNCLFSLWGASKTKI